MQQYRLKRMFADVWAVESWGVVNFDGIPAHDWKHVKTYYGDKEAVDGYEFHKFGSVSVGKDYFTTYEDNDQIIALHETFEDALEYIEKTSAAPNRIEEIGGSWDVFKKCNFCGEWTPTTELNDEHICTYCEQAIKSHGGI